MRAGSAVAISIALYPLILTAMLAANFPGEEGSAVALKIGVEDFPATVRICPEEPLEEDVAWAVEEWNRAFKAYDTPLRMEVAADDCLARVKPTYTPLGGEFGGQMDWVPREGVNVSALNPEEVSFRMFEIQITVWAVEDRTLRRAIILHELGHAILLGHIEGYKGPGPRPVMSAEMSARNPTAKVTDMDAYYARFRHSPFCKTYGCGKIHIRMVNPVYASTIATLTSAGIAGVLTRWRRGEGGSGAD